MEVDVQTVREKWVDYNKDLISKYAADRKVSGKKLDLLTFFAIEFLIDFESEIEEDPENLDGGILTLDTIYASYMDGFLGRWYIQKTENPTEEGINAFMDVFSDFYAYLKENKLYKEGAAQHTKLMKRLGNRKKYLKRLNEFLEIQKVKDDEEQYLDLMQEWEYEDLY
jgi:hypothetical protein